MDLTRRNVILGAAAATFGLTRVGEAASLLAEGQDDRKIGWAILGLGGYAIYQIIPSFKDCQHSKLVALVSGTPEKLNRYGTQYGIPESHRYSYETFERIKDNPDVDVVYVITPPATHPKFSIQAAEAGKHVCSEKPMAPTVADCDAMIAACRKANKLLQIGYRSHYEPSNMRAIAACRNGEIGDLRSITSDHGFSISPGVWRIQRKLSGGGSMMDIGIYSLQALLYLAGEDPVEVSAQISNPKGDDRFKEVEDTVHFQLRFPSGLLASGTSGYSWRPGANRYKVIGTAGTLEAEPATSYGGNRLRLKGQDVPLPPVNQFAAQMDHLSECILKNTPVRTPGEMGRRDIHLVQAIYESARLGHPVKV